MIIILINKYEKAVGPLFACQLAIKLFIEDTTNSAETCLHAETIYKWLGSVECSVNELFAVSYDNSIFILDALEKYQIKTSDSNLLLNYSDAIESLKYQKSLI